MRESICGLDCEVCGWKSRCSGCSETCGHPFGGECIMARCCARRGLSSCTECGDRCALKRRAIDEFNALGIPDMPEVTELNVLDGAFINLEYTLPSGQKVKFWRDGEMYLGNQLERAGSDRCYGLAADDEHIMVCEYGENGSGAEVIVYRKRSGIHD